MKPVNIEVYTEKHTSEKHPWEARIVKAYLESMLMSTDILTQYALTIEAITTEFLPNSFWKTANHFNTPQHRAIIAYSMIKKDNNLFKAIQHMYFPNGFVRMFISRELFTSYIETTDEEVLVDGQEYIGATDMNFYTDMNTGFIYQVFMEVYGADSDKDLGLIGVNDLLANEAEMNDFLTIVKPARVSIIPARTPCIIIGYRDSFIESGLAEITNKNDSDYLLTTSNINAFKNMSLIDLQNLIPDKITLDGSLLSRPVPLSFEVREDYLDCVYYIQRDSVLVENLQDIWKGLIFYMEGYGRLVFNIKDIKDHPYSSIYFAKAIVSLPYKH